MPFRYVKGEDGQPVMPEVPFPSEVPRDEFSADLGGGDVKGMLELIGKDADKSFDDFF